MDNFLEILKIVLPCLVIGATCFLIMRSFMDFETKKAKVRAENAKMDIIIPARMQAYERVILLLERITPENLIRRTIKITFTARIFQAELVSAIRQEYEHNVSQ